MSTQEHIEAFAQLGAVLASFCKCYSASEGQALLKGAACEPYYQQLEEALFKAEQNNRWFSKEMQIFSLESWGKLLNEAQLSRWLSAYSFSQSKRVVAVVQAGNIPLVGFHDFLSVLVSGHRFLGKASSKDKILPQLLGDILIAINAQYQERIEWVEKIENFDAVIATGSNNTSQYFEYYFGKKPHIFRKNMSSVAVLKGNESPAELEALAKDIFMYYGLGCRNVSKIHLPQNYDFKPLFEAAEKYHWVYSNNKYANNYDYNQSVYLLNQVDFLQNGFLILKEDAQLHSPLSVVHYEFYSSTEALNNKLIMEAANTQCLLCSSELKTDINSATYRLGQAQSPQLDDYADKIDTLNFLSQL